jgi:tyrosinase
VLVEILINNNSNQPAARYLTWAWSPCRIRVTNPVGILGATAQVQLSQTALPGGGAIRFSSTASGAGSATMNVTVPANGTSVPFFVRGITASTADPGVRITARWKRLPIGPLTTVGNVDLMVRIRKSAVNLNTGERNRLLSALAVLNNQGLGRFADFRDMHVAASNLEAHGRPGFLPWHRAYLLDLERELQAIDRSVALPYWRFDQPGPALFTPDFFGQGNNNNPVVLSPANPLLFWRTDGVTGIVRQPNFNVNSAPPGVLTQAQTLALGTAFAAFRTMEGNPHAQAHVSFSGFLQAISQAARDPLFFLLHCNVDRLWAAWQKANNRYDVAVPAAFDTPVPPNPPNRIGHNLGDTMWPWNGVVTPPRPAVAPGGPLAASACVAAPGNTPRVRNCFDYQGSLATANNLGFSYDDIPL